MDFWLLYGNLFVCMVIVVTYAESFINYEY